MAKGFLIFVEKGGFLCEIFTEIKLNIDFNRNNITKPDFLTVKTIDIIGRK